MLFRFKQGLVLMLAVDVHKAVRYGTQRGKRHDLAVDAAKAFAR